MTHWALITGAARRIGRVTALALAEAGWNIVIHYKTSRAEAEQLAEDIKAKGRNAYLVAADLADAESASHLIPRLVAELGSLAALINNASLFEPDARDPDGARHQTMNVAAPRLLSKALYSAAAGTHGTLPVIVNLLDADPSKPHFASYNRSKIALAEMTRDLALRFAPKVRVNGVALGAILPSPRESPEHFSALVKSSPLALPITPEAVASTIRFLLENNAITGVIIPVDGGAHFKRDHST